MEVGTKIQLLRAKRGWTVRELAQRAGIEPASLSRIETGKTKPYLSTLGKIANALEIDLEQLATFPVEEAKSKDNLLNT